MDILLGGKAFFRCCIRCLLIGRSSDIHVTNCNHLTHICCCLFSRSQRQLVAAWNKECQFDFLAETVEEPADLYAAIPYHQLDEASDATSPPLPVRQPKRPTQMIQKDERASTNLDKHDLLWLLFSKASV